MKRGMILGLSAMLLFSPNPVEGQGPVAAVHEVDGASLHYLDFGGDGLPVVFIHAADRGAETWTEFGPVFTDDHRVLALTARGVGESTGQPSPTDVRAGDLLSFLDSLGISRAVFIGNSSPAEDMT